MELSDVELLSIFRHLEWPDLRQASMVSCQWCRVARDRSLWTQQLQGRPAYPLIGRHWTRIRAGGARILWSAEDLVDPCLVGERIVSLESHDASLLVARCLFSREIKIEMQADALDAFVFGQPVDEERFLALYTDATDSSLRRVRIWQVATGKLLASCQVRAEFVIAAASARWAVLACLGTNHWALREWKMTDNHQPVVRGLVSGEEMLGLPIVVGDVAQLPVSHDGDWYHWDLGTSSRCLPISIPRQIKGIRPVKGMPGMVAAFGRGIRHRLELRRLEDTRWHAPFRAFGDKPFSAVAVDGGLVYMGDKAGSVFVQSFEGGKRLKIWEGEEPIKALFAQAGCVVILEESKLAVIYPG